MTLFGKILVCLNLVFSLGMAAVALGIYTQRINWTHQPAETTPEKAAGELALRRTEIEKQGKALLLAETRQEAALKRLRGLDAKRPANQAWYNQELKHMEKTATEANPVRELTLVDGKVKLDEKTGLPEVAKAVDRSRQPLRSLEWYDTELKDVSTQIVAEEEKLHKLVKEDNELTVKAVGDKDVPNSKGLRQRIEEEEFKRQRVELEIQDFVQPQLINVQVESELLLKRRNALQARVRELEQVPVRFEER